MGNDHSSTGLSRRTALGAVLAGIGAVAAFEVVGPAPAAHAAVIYQFPFSPSTTLPAGVFGDTTPPYHSTPHRGRDFSPGALAPIPAAANGTVVRRELQTGLGNILLIDHHDGYFSGYSHMAAAATVGMGVNVSRGQIIGHVGNTGSLSFGPHLHFTIGTSTANPDKGSTIDPFPFINARSSDTSPNPTNPTPNLSGDHMIRIQSTNRGIALIGAGYYRQLATTEEVEQSAAIMEKHLTGNDRQFDLWVSMALKGVAARPQQ
jgi:murein DD-endopeptidase MepM/ murein hydrolase activator NlpD